MRMMQKAPASFADRSLAFLNCAVRLPQALIAEEIRSRTRSRPVRLTACRKTHTLPPNFRSPAFLPTRSPNDLVVLDGVGPGASRRRDDYAGRLLHHLFRSCRADRRYHGGARPGSDGMAAVAAVFSHRGCVAAAVPWPPACEVERGQIGTEGGRFSGGRSGNSAGIACHR